MSHGVKTDKTHLVGGALRQEICEFYIGIFFWKTLHLSNYIKQTHAHNRKTYKIPLCRVSTHTIEAKLYF